MFPCRPMLEPYCAACAEKNSFMQSLMGSAAAGETTDRRRRCIECPEWICGRARSNGHVYTTECRQRIDGSRDCAATTLLIGEMYGKEQRSEHTALCHACRYTIIRQMTVFLCQLLLCMPMTFYCWHRLLRHYKNFCGFANRNWTQ